MQDDDFEWDDEKAARNVAKHKITFDMARDVFSDPYFIDWQDERFDDFGEDRFAAVGMVEGRLLYVAFTLRGKRIRIISARRAEGFERRKYHEEN
jgi:uncharacterized protein